MFSSESLGATPGAIAANGQQATTAAQTAAAKPAAAATAATNAAPAKAAAASAPAQPLTKEAKKAAEAAKKAAEEAAKKAADLAAQKKAADEEAKKKAAEEKAKKDKIAARKKKIRTHSVDIQLIAWDSKSSQAEAYLHGKAQKMVGMNGKYLVKDTVFSTDSSKFICIMRINVQDKIPENWYLESEMAAGFGTNYQRAYESAMARASSRVDAMGDGSDWVGIESCLRNTAEDGILPYSIVFEMSGKEYCCKVYFRYFKKRK